MRIGAIEAGGTKIVCGIGNVQGIIEEHKEVEAIGLIREEVRKMLNGYVGGAAITSGLNPYIVPPESGCQAGLCGALALGLAAAGR